MKYYKQQLKRIKVTRKLHKAQNKLLSALRMEGFTQVTFHTTTRSITLPFDAGTTYEACSVYTQFLDSRIDGLKQEARQVKQEWERDLEVGEEKSKQRFDATAKVSEQGSTPLSN